MKIRSSLQRKVVLILLVSMSVPLFFTWYIAKSQMQAAILQEKEGKLLGFAHILDAKLGAGGFDAILREAGAEQAPAAEQIAVINRALASVTDTVAAASPGLGVGYYSLKLDAILTYGPSDQYGDAVGRAIPADHPGRIVMAEGKPLIRSGTMVRGNILNAMMPVTRDGEILGYIWANELSTEIMRQLDAMARNTLLIMTLCLGMAVVAIVIFSRRLVRDADRIIRGVRAMRGDLSTRIADSSGELGEVVRSINSMAEDLNKANIETQRAIAVLQSVINNVDATVYVCDPQTKTLIYTNDYLCRLIGRDDLQGKLCYETLQGASEPCSFCPQRQLFAKDGTPNFNLVRWETHNPVINRDFLVTDRLITWHDGRLLHMEVGTDVTERKALAVAEAANLAQRDFLARMSHELRTPMNGVLGMTHVALQADPPPRHREYLKKIQSSASLLLGIINDILDFSRIEAGKMSIEEHNFNLRDTLATIRELITPRTEEKGLDFSITVDDSVPVYVVGDELRLSQVLLNLLGNASKFTLAGTVSLAVRAEPSASGAIRLHCAVADTGIGISAEQQGLLFQPFTQADSSTSREFGGTGLGLSISKALVELMGGAIAISSEAGKGSVFSFFVELAAGEAPQGETAEPAALAEARYDGRRVLLVEDNDINQEIALTLLEETGLSVDVADNGEAGVEAFTLRDYNLILMDVRMPIMDGLEATRRIRASAKHDAKSVPIIAMTANAMKEDRDASRDAGMNAHIAKPIDVWELKSVLARVLGARE